MSAPLCFSGFRAKCCGLFLLFLLVPNLLPAAVDFADPARSKEFRGIIKDYSRSWQLYESMAPKTLAGLVGEYVFLRDEDSLTVQIDTLWFRNAGQEIVARYVVSGEMKQRFALVKNRGRGLKITLDAKIEAPPVATSNVQNEPAPVATESAPDNEVDAAFEPESVPEAEPDVKSEPEIVSEPEPQAVSESVPIAEAASESVPEPDPVVESETAPEPETKSQSEPEAAPDPEAVSDPVATESVRENTSGKSGPIPPPPLDEPTEVEPQVITAPEPELDPLTRPNSDRSPKTPDVTASSAPAAADSTEAELARLRTSERLLRQELSELRNRITLQAGLQDSIAGQQHRIDSLAEENKVLDAMNWESAEKVRSLMADQIESDRLRAVNDSLFFRIKQLEDNSRQDINTDSLLAEMNALRETNERAQRRFYIIGKLQEERDSLTQLNSDLQATLRRRNLSATEATAAERDSLVQLVADAEQEAISLRDSLAGRERLLQSLSSRLERAADPAPDTAISRAVDSLRDRGGILENRLLAREARIEDLRRELTALRDSINNSVDEPTGNADAEPDQMQAELNAGRVRIAELQARVEELRDRADAANAEQGSDERADSLARIVETLGRANSRLRSDVDQLESRRKQAENANLDLRDTLTALRSESVAVVTDLSTRLDSMGILLVSQIATIKQLNDSLDVLQKSAAQPTASTTTAAADSAVPVAVYDSIVAHLQQARSTAAALEINLKLADANVGRLSDENSELRTTLEQRENAIAALKQERDALAAEMKQREVEGVIRPEDAALMNSLIARADSLGSRLLMAQELQDQAEVRSETLFRQMLDERERAGLLVRSYDSLMVWAGDTLAILDAQRSLLNAELNDLRDRMEQLRADARAEADVEKSVAWVAVGTERELRNRGLIQGRGANLRLVEPLDPEDFNIARRDARIIELADRPFPAERLQLLTHPQADYSVSYHPTGDATATLLTIDKPEVFWRTSEFLVVLLR